MDIGSIGILVGFGAGVLSFLSPCVFPLIPAYLAQLSGTSFQELQEMQDNDRRRIMVRNSIAFVLGLVIVFTLFGASATFLGRFFLNNQVLVGRIAGFAIVLFGLHLMGVIQIPWLMRESRMDLADARQRSTGLTGSLFMGAAFGVGWTPCIGPVLASILAIASQADTVVTGMVLLLAYALGLGVPFIVMALILNRAAGQRIIGRMRQYMPQLTVTSGALLILMGLLVFTGNLIELSNLFTQTFGTGLTLKTKGLRSIGMKKMWKAIILVLVVGIMTGDLILDYRMQAQAHSQDTEAAELLGLSVGIAVGELAPDFTGTTVEGETFTLSDLKGKMVLVNVFASWCGPCRVETPHLVEVYNAIDKDQFEFIGLNLQETPEAVEFFRDEFFIDYPLVLNEGGDLTDIYRPIGLPTTWFIDRDGVIGFTFSGPMTKEALQVILEDVEAGREPDPFAVIG